MMKRREQKTLGTWLLAEKTPDHAAAERALFRVFATLPQARPSSGFADRVLVAAGVQMPSRTWGWLGRSLIIASLLLVALSSTFLVPAAVELLGLLKPTEVVTALVDGGLTVGHRLQDVLPLWQLATTFYRTLVQVIGAPPVLITLLAMTMLSGLAFRSLISLVPARRSFGYA